MNLLSCKEVTFLASVRHERGLNWRERTGVTLHLAICRGCREFARHMQLLREALAHSEKVMGEQDDVRLSVDGQERIRAALDKLDR